MSASERAASIFWITIGVGIAQMNTGEVSGSVQDQLGGVLPGAAITAERTATGQKFTTISNHAGQYLLAQLPIGLYTISAGAANFKQMVLSKAEIHVGDRLRYDFTLQLGASGETVVVEENEDELHQTAEIKDLLRNRTIVGLPLKSRQFLDLAMLREGVVRPPGGTRGDAMQQAGTLVNVLGQRSGHNLYLVDGATVTDEHFNNLVIAPSIDSISEVSVQKTAYAPEFGGKSGAVINVVTRSGSNALHGSLFEFLRNNRLDAKNFFDSPTGSTPPFRQNQFGASVGGSVIRNKTLFFVSYEGLRARKSLTQTFSVPTAAMRTGDFSGLAAIYDPGTADAGTRTPLAGNRIPVQRLDLAAAALLETSPLPNLPGVAQNLRATGQQRIDTNAYSARLDHQFSAKDTAYARFSLFDARQADPFGSGVLQESLLPGFGRGLSTHSLNGVAGWTRAIGSAAVSEARFAFLTVVGGQTSPNAGNPFASRTGLLGVTADPRDMGYPQMSFGGQFTTMGDPALFTYRDNRDFEFADNASIHWGAHTAKFGVYWMHYDFRPVNPNGARGIFSFTPRFTSSVGGLADGNPFADFLLGYPSTAQAGLGRASLDADTDWAHFYVQDTWRVSRNFQFDAGVRYEYNRNMTDSGNRMAAIDPGVPGGRFVIASDGHGTVAPETAALLPLIPIPYVTSEAAGWNNSLLTRKPWRLAPRAGFSWNLPGAKMAVRGGFGVYPNQAAYSIIGAFAQNLPFFATRTVNASTTGAPVFRTENALATSSLGTVGGNNLDHDFQIEYNEVWNLNLERELARGTTLRAAYIGSRTVHADSSTVVNVPLPGPGAIAARRPIPQLSQFTTIRWDGWAKYHAFTMGIQRRIEHGPVFDVNWTWSHSIDDASDPGATLNEANVPQDVYNMRAEKASSSFDHRHRVVASVVYRLPGPARGWRRAAFGDWQAGGYFTAQSGAPFTVNLASDPANVGGGPAQRPNVSGDPNRGPHTPDQWFDPTVFSLPSLYTFGNSPRNGVIGPGLRELDFSMQKEIAWKERARVQFRAESYNVTNHPNFNIPNRTALTANTGRVTSAGDSRQMQFAIKLVF